MRPTVKDVALRAGVSVGTVSRFLNGHRLRDHSARRVREAIESLGFHQNIYAKALKGNRSMMIAVLVPNLIGLFSFEIIKAMASILEQEGYALLIGDFESSAQRLRDAIDRLARLSVDALVITPMAYGREAAGELRAMQDSGVQIITMDDRIPGVDCDLVGGTQEEASREAVRSLVDLGHTDILVVAGRRGTDVTRERIAGARAAVRGTGASLTVLWTDLTIDGVRKALGERWRSVPPPTAIYAITYYSHIGTYLALRDQGLSVPADISLIGHGRFAATEVMDPEPAVLRMDLARHGEEAARLLLRRLRGDLSDAPTEIRFPLRFERGQSIGAPPAPSPKPVLQPAPETTRKP